MPSEARLTSAKPMTAPECSARLNAPESDWLAETVVRALPAVAIFMPM